MPLASTLLSTVTASLLLMFGEIRYEFSPLTDASGTAYVDVISTTNEKNVRVKIEGDNGFKLEKTISLRANKPGKVKWKQKDKNVSYDIHVEAGEQYMDAVFDVKKAVAGGAQGNFTVLSDRPEIVERKTIRYKTPFTVASWEFEVWNTDGEKIWDKVGTEPYEAGSEITMKWDREDEVFMIVFRGEDDLGRNAVDKRVPWSVAIPHTEVNFDSGKHNIKDTEAPKIDEAFAVLVHELDGLEKANKAVGANLTAQLYIVGYTDTVGNAGKNQVLSLNRAKEIAKYFYDKGAWCEIHYQGMGERGLRVETDDNVDEVRNRRALYLLGVQKPAGGGEVPGSWKKLADARPRTLMALPELPDSYWEWKNAKKKGKGGSSDGGGDGDGDGAQGDGDSDWGSADPESLAAGGSDASADDGGPPPVDGEPGASGKGCEVRAEGSTTGSAGLLALLGAIAWRRRRAD